MKVVMVMMVTDGDLRSLRVTDGDLLWLIVTDS